MRRSGFFNSILAGWRGLNPRLRNGILLTSSVLNWAFLFFAMPRLNNLGAACLAAPIFALQVFFNFRLGHNNPWYWGIFVPLLMLTALWNRTGFMVFHEYPLISYAGIMSVLPVLFYAKRVFSG